MTDHAMLLAGLEAGGTKFVCAVGRSPLEIIRKTTIPTTTPAETLSACKTFFLDAQSDLGPLDACGAAAFGPIDIEPGSTAYGRIGPTPKAGWNDADICSAFPEGAAPIAIDTDVSGAAVAEAAYGAGANCRVVAYATIGTGVGVGVASDGRALSGVRHFEMGHIRVSRDHGRDAFMGACPFHGDCLEGLASGPAIRARWGRELRNFPHGSDEVALIADYIGQLALTISLTHAPDRIVLGGGVMKTPGLIEAVRRSHTRLLAGYPAGPRPGAATPAAAYIMLPALGDECGVTGALLLAANRLRLQSRG